MKLHNIFRNTFAVLFLSASFGMALSSCSDANATQPDVEALATLSEVPSGPDTTAVAQQELELVRAVACADIENREPVNVDSKFDAAVGKVWIYSKVKLPKGSSHTLTHTYYFKGKEVQSVDLDVKGPAFRTRSYKTITPGMEGDWTVKITDENGTELEEIAFTIN